MELLIHGALANTGGEVSSEEFLTFLMENTNDVEFYRFSPRPGAIVAAAFDWQAILGVTASSIAIAQALWAAYKKFHFTEFLHPWFFFVQRWGKLRSMVGHGSQK